MDTNSILFNIIMAIVFIILSIGFYTEKLDWIMIYYGCAPKNKKKNMPKEKIKSLCWIGFLFIAMGFALCTLLNVLGYNDLIYYTHLIIICVIIVIIGITAYWCTYYDKNSGKTIKNKKSKIKTEKLCVMGFLNLLALISMLLMVFIIFFTIIAGVISEGL